MWFTKQAKEISHKILEIIKSIEEKQLLVKDYGRNKTKTK